MLKNLTEHDYYCESWESRRTTEYDSWDEFKNEDLDYDLSYNLLFRYDLEAGLDEDGNETDEKVLYLHHALQRHGTEQWHAVIHNIKEDDLPEINEHLIKAWKYLKSYWKEIDLPEKNLDDDFIK